MTDNNYTAEFNARVTELQRHYKVAQTAAAAVGYIKPEGITWDEAAELIADAEFQKEGKQVYAEIVRPLDVIASVAGAGDGSEPTEGLDLFVPSGRYATEFYRANGIPFCKQCGEQFLSDDQGKPVCAERLTACPRLKQED